jgi:ankyrin repeat protein
MWGVITSRKNISNSLKEHLFGYKILKSFIVDPDPGSGAFSSLDMGSTIFFLLAGLLQASPDEATVRGETPLHLAARANQTDIIRILLRNGAKVDARARVRRLNIIRILPGKIEPRLCSVADFWASRIGSASGSESGSISQRYGSADPDPYQNCMDPQH